ADPLFDVCVGVVDDVVGAALARESELLVRRRTRDDACAHQLAEFDCREPRAARRAEYRERLAGLELGAIFQGVQRGAVDHRDAGGAIEVERTGNFHHALRADRDLLARGTKAAIAEYAIAVRKA